MISLCTLISRCRKIVSAFVWNSSLPVHHLHFGEPLEFAFSFTFRQLWLMLRAFPVTLCVQISLLGLSVFLLWDLISLSVSNLTLIQNNINNFFCELSSSFLDCSKIRFLLMVLNVIKKLLQQWLQMTTFKLLYCVGSLTIYLYCWIACCSSCP